MKWHEMRVYAKTKKIMRVDKTQIRNERLIWTSE